MNKGQQGSVHLTRRLGTSVASAFLPGMLFDEQVFVPPKTPCQAVGVVKGSTTTLTSRNSLDHVLLLPQAHPPQSQVLLYMKTDTASGE